MQRCTTMGTPSAPHRMTASDKGMPNKAPDVLTGRAASFILIALLMAAAEAVAAARAAWLGGCGASTLGDSTFFFDQKGFLRFFSGAIVDEMDGVVEALAAATVVVLAAEVMDRALGLSGMVDTGFAPHA